MNGPVLPTTDVVRALLDPATPTNDPVVQLFQTALSGFGYDLYDPRNAARANDLLVREKGAALLGTTARTLGLLERRYRERFIPAASREHPYPAPDLARCAKRVHDLERRCDALATALLTCESPGSDAIWSRVRDERPTLDALLAADIALVVGIGELPGLVARLDPEAVTAEAPLAELDAMLDRLEGAIDARRRTLAI